MQQSEEEEKDAAAVALRSEESLAYKLLLRKSREVAVDGASTAAPVSSAASTLSDPAELLARCETRLLRNVAIHPPFEDARVEGLVGQTRKLSQEIFDEDCLQEITKKSGWKLSLLVSEDLSVLCGFVVAKVSNGTLSIAKIAVPTAMRGRGFGRCMMDELIKGVRKQGDVYEVALSSLPTAVTFYQRLGFRAFKGVKLSSEDDLVEGQVYMEKKLRNRPRRMR